MKTLILVRHGKSSWEYNVNDRDRPLSELGIADVQKVTGAFAAKRVKIDMGFASPAIRALHTAMIFTRGVSLPLGNFGVRDRLYDFSGESVMDFIADLDDALDSVLIFGHNHALTHLANSLGNTYIDNVPTAGLVHLGFDTPHWKSVSKGITVQTLFPKKL